MGYFQPESLAQSSFFSLKVVQFGKFFCCFLRPELYSVWLSMVNFVGYRKLFSGGFAKAAKVKSGPTKRAVGRLATFRFAAFFRSNSFSRFVSHSRGNPPANANRWPALPIIFLQLVWLWNWRSACTISVTCQKLTFAFTFPLGSSIVFPIELSLKLALRHCSILGNQAFFQSGFPISSTVLHQNATVVVYQKSFRLVFSFS